MTPNKEAAQSLKNFNNLIEADRLINELGSIVQGSHAHILIKRAIVDMAEAQTTTEALNDHGKAEGDIDNAPEQVNGWKTIQTLARVGKGDDERMAFPVDACLSERQKPSEWKDYICRDYVEQLLASHTPQTVDVEAAQDALDKIAEWSKAYPESVFPKPDLYKVRLALEVNGLTLDAVSADNMRHVITKVYEILEPVRALLASRGLLGTVPEGWKLVPIEPTEEMITAVMNDMKPSRTSTLDAAMRLSIRRAYKILLGRSV